MKKLSLYISIALAGLFMGSCSEDYTDWANPQTNPQEDAITIPGYQASAVSAFDLANVTEDSVSVYTISSAALPDGFSLENSRIELTPEGVENAKANEVKTSLDGKAAKADLQSLIESVYGKSPVARTFSGHVYTNAVKDGEAALIDAGTVKVTVTPVAPNISQNYYIIGGALDWTVDAAKTQKFSHSDVNVYDDPVFTITIPAKQNDDTWFAIVDDAACNAIATNNDWSSVIGTTKGNGNNGLNETEQLDTRANVGNEASFKVPASAGAKYIKIEINMLDYTYKITPLSFGEYFYEIGGETGWTSTHALYGGNGDGKYQGFYYLNGEFKFKPQEGTSDWSGDYEFNGEGKIADCGGPNCPDPGAGFYQIDVDLQAGTYALTKVNSITVVGNHNGWNEKDAACHMTYNAEAGCWELTTALKDGFKFAMNDDWTTSWGGANGDATAYNNLSVNNGKDLQVPNGEGTYKIQLFLSHEGANKVVLTKQ